MPHGPRLLVTGASGFLGAHVAMLAQREWSFLARDQCAPLSMERDATDFHARTDMHFELGLHDLLVEHAPQRLVHAAANPRRADGERDLALVWRVHVDATPATAEQSARTKRASCTSRPTSSSARSWVSDPRHGSRQIELTRAAERRNRGSMASIGSIVLLFSGRARIACLRGPWSKPLHANDRVFPEGATVICQTVETFARPVD